MSTSASENATPATISQPEAGLSPVDAVSFAPALARRISVNAAAKLAAELIGRAVQFGFTILAARRLAEADFGAYAYGLALGFVLAQATDLGLQIIVTREVARNEAAAPRTVGIALGLKLVLSAPVLALLAGLSLARSAAATRGPILALGASMLLFSYVEFFGYVFRGRQQLMDEALLISLARACPAVLGAGLILAGGGLAGLAWVTLAATAGAALLAYGRLRARGVVPLLQFDRQVTGRTALWLLHQALPLGIAIGLSILYTRTAFFLLEPLRGLAAVAIYNLAYGLYEPLQILPAALLAAVFPVFAQSVASTAPAGAPQAATRSQRDDTAAWLQRRTLGPLALMSLVLVPAGVLTAPFLINLLYGRPDYAEAGPALQIMMLAVPPMFITYALTHFLIALGQQRWNALLSLVALVSNIALNLALIPALGPRGAALALALSEAILFVFALSLWRRFSLTK